MSDETLTTNIAMPAVQVDSIKICAPVLDLADIGDFDDDYTNEFF